VVIVAGGAFVLAVQGTPAAGLAPYADSVLVMVSGAALMAVPFGLLRRSINELQSPVPNPVVQQEVREVVEAVRQQEELPEPILRIGRMGATITIELGFVLEPGTGDVACEDRVRRAVRAGLAELPYELWIVVEFSHDRSLVE
jgi:predicted Co/Zn/Cd cation transporter (cation efflux family)